MLNFNFPKWTCRECAGGARECAGSDDVSVQSVTLEGGVAVLNFEASQAVEIEVPLFLDNC